MCGWVATNYAICEAPIQPLYIITRNILYGASPRRSSGAANAFIVRCVFHCANDTASLQARAASNAVLNGKKIVLVAAQRTSYMDTNHRQPDVKVCIPR